MGSILLITRPPNEAEELKKELTDLGYDCLIDPVLTHRDLPEATEQLRQRLNQGDIQMVVATSPRVIAAVSAAMKDSETPLLLVGGKLENLARKAGIVNLKGSVKNAKILINTIRARAKPDEGKILYVRGEDVSHDMVNELGEFQVEEILTYSMDQAESLSEETRQSLRTGGIQAALFYSERSVHAFMALAKQAGLATSLRNVHAFCLSPKIAEAARQCIWKSITPSPVPTSAALIETVRRKLPPDVAFGHS